MNLRYHTVDDTCKRAKKLGPVCFSYKKDMSREFHQIPMDPRDWSLLGIYWDGVIFLDKAAVMESQSAPYICQQVMSTIRYIMSDLKYYTKNYVDDFMGIELRQQVWQTYNTLGNLLRNLGVSEAPDKVVPPVEVVEFLGTGFD